MPLKTILFALAAPLALLAAETPASKTDAARTPAGRAMLEKLIPDVEGVSKEEMAKFRAASPKAQQDPAVIAVRDKLNELRKRAEFASPDEKKEMRGEFEGAAELNRNALKAAYRKADPTLAKETIEKVIEAFEDKARARIKAAAEKDTKASATPTKPFPFGDDKTKPTDGAAPAAKKAGGADTARAKAQPNLATLLADIDGVPAEDMAKYRIASMKAFRDPEVQAAREKLKEMGANAQFLSAKEKGDMREQFEVATGVVRKATRAAIAKNDPSLSAETIAKISEVVEERMRPPAR
jgi:hypothetical protein